MAYFFAQWNLWWQRKYPQIWTTKKLSEKLLCDGCIPLREIYLFSHKVGFNTVPVKLKKWYLAAVWRLGRKVKYPEMKPRKNRSRKLLSDVCIRFRELKLPLHCQVWKLCLWGICEVILSRPKPCGEKGNVFPWKLERSFRSNCFVMCLLIS